MPFPPFADADAVVQVRGMDSGGQTVTAETTVPVAIGDTRIVPGTCAADDRTLCALDDRFKVTVDWRNETESGPGQVADDGRFFDGAYFWFFAPENTEILVQVLDQCSFNDRYWVFFAATTNVEWTVTVTDATVGVTREFFNPLGSSAASVTDTEAFATCP